jgi:hypothetical protein
MHTRYDVYYDGSNNLYMIFDCLQYPALLPLRKSPPKNLIYSAKHLESLGHTPTNEAIKGLMKKYIDLSFFVQFIHEDMFYFMGILFSEKEK